MAGDARAAAVGRQQRGQHAERRRLAGAVRPEQAEDLARLDRERDAVDGGDLAEPDDEVVDEDGGLDEDVCCSPEIAFLRERQLSTVS